MSRQTLPLNSAQKWLLSGGASPFRSLTQVSLSFGEAMHGESVRSTWNAVFLAHPSLRVRFGASEQMHQFISDSAEATWSEVDWSGENLAEVGAKWQALLKEDREKPFSDKDPALSRFHLITLPGGSSHLLWTFSEMIADKESIHLVIREFLKRYEGAEIPQEEDEGWRQFAEWSANSENSTYTFPTETFGDTPGVSLLGLDGQEGASTWEQTHLMNPDRIQAAQHCADNLQIPLTTVLEAAWAMVVARLTGREDIVYTRNYTARGLLLRHEAIGCFTAAIPTFIHVDDGAKAGDWIRSLSSSGKFSGFPHPPANVRKETLIAATHFELRPEEIITNSPRWVRLDVRIHPSTSCRSLRIEWDGSPQQPFKFCSNEDYFPSSRYQELLGYFEHALDTLTRTPNRLLWDIGILSRNERTGILEKSQGKHASENATLTDILALACSRTSSHPAVVIGSESLNYEELNDYASRFAKYLKDAGLQKGDLILFNLHATSWLWVALLGTLKIGAVAVPIFSSEQTEGAISEYPFEFKAILCDSSTLTASEAISGTIQPVAIDQSWDAIYATAPLDAASSASGDNAALAFLSGKEKDSVVTYFSHRSIANAARMLSERLRLRSSDRIPQFWNSSQTGFYEQLFAAMHAGATMVLDTVPHHPSELTPWMDSAQISALYCETAAFDLWMSASKQTPLPTFLRIMAIRGDLPSTHADSVWKNSAPSELERVSLWAVDNYSTVCIELHEQEDSIFASICDNTIAYVLDGPRLAPNGTQGELVIGGFVLASQKPEAGNGGKYIYERDPLSSAKDARRLRCGITARRMEDGKIAADFPRYQPPQPKPAPVLPSPVKSRAASAQAPEESPVHADPPFVMAAKASADGIFWIREADGKSPLFLIHPAKESLEIYQPLLRHLPEDIPCAALTTSLLQANEELFVETLANRYIETLQKLHPDGSWHIAAYGNGAWIAWEMTQILALKNREFATIAIIDAVPPRTAGFKGLLQTGLSFGKKREANSPLPGEDANWHFSYRAYEGPAKLHILSRNGAATLGWKSIAPAALPHEIKAAGDNFLEEPQVKFVADFIANRLRRTRGKNSSQPVTASNKQPSAVK